MQPVQRHGPTEGARVMWDVAAAGAAGGAGLASRVVACALFLAGAALVFVFAVWPKVRAARRGSLRSRNALAQRGPLSVRLHALSEAIVRSAWAWLLVFCATGYGLGGSRGAPGWSIVALIVLLLVGVAAWFVLRAAARVAERAELRDDNSVRAATGRSPRRHYLRPVEVGWLSGLAGFAGLLALVAVLQPTVDVLFPAGSLTQAQLRTLTIVVAVLLGGYLLVAASTVYGLIRRQRGRIAAEEARLRAEDAAALRPTAASD
jgi:hypothetical protein